MKRTLFFILALMLTAAMATQAMAEGGGQENMRRARQALDNTDIKAAERFLNRAIHEMEVAGTIKGADEDLARAYYLKANIMLARPHKAAELEKLLTLAVQAAPQFVPDQAFITDPRIVPVYKRVLSRHRGQGQQAVTLAGRLLEKRDYCGAAKVLRPFRNAFGADEQQALGEGMLHAAEQLCEAPGKNVPPPMAGGQVPIPTSGNSEAKPEAIAAGERVCGLLPVLIQNLPDKSALSRNFSMDALQRSLAKAGVFTRQIEISPMELDQWKRRHEIANLKEFAGRSLITFGWSIGDLFKGKTKELDVAMGALPKRYAAALEELMAQQGVSQVLLVFVEAVRPSGGSGDTPDVDILVNLFSKQDVRKPSVSHVWRGMAEITAEGRFAEIGEMLKKELGQSR